MSVPLQPSYEDCARKRRDNLCYNALSMLGAARNGSDNKNGRKPMIDSNRRTVLTTAAAAAAATAAPQVFAQTQTGTPQGAPAGAKVGFYEKGNVRIRYAETGSGFPLLAAPGGGLNSCIAVWSRAVINIPEEF